MSDRIIVGGPAAAGAASRGSRARAAYHAVGGVYTSRMADDHARVLHRPMAAWFRDSRESRSRLSSPGCAMLIMAMLLAAAGCGQRTVFGHIPPSTFQFVTVVEHDGRGAGGWQVAQVVVLLGRLSTMFPRTAFCDVEVGMPVVNRQQGYISVETAQIASASASDQAARELFQQREKPTVSICNAFRTTMEYILANKDIGMIRGSRVTHFRNWPGKKVPRRTFPPKRGR